MNYSTYEVCKYEVGLISEVAKFTVRSQLKKENLSNSKSIKQGG